MTEETTTRQKRRHLSREEQSSHAQAFSTHAQAFNTRARTLLCARGTFTTPCLRLSRPPRVCLAVLPQGRDNSLAKAPTPQPQGHSLPPIGSPNPAPFPRQPCTPPTNTNAPAKSFPCPCLRLWQSLAGLADQGREVVAVVHVGNVEVVLRSVVRRSQFHAPE